MRERKYVKFRVDMYDDTKFKIIDMKPERDLIHYVWTRLVTLAGKVNLAGDLYLSKNIPYTLETLAIEFNRNIDQIKLALDALIELEMIDFNENKIYNVKNFAKHQNIKVDEKIKSKDTDKNNNVIKNTEGSVSENIQSDIIHNKDNKFQNKNNLTELQNVKNNAKNNLEINYTNYKDSNQSNNNIINKKRNNNSTSSSYTSSHDNISMPLQIKKIKKSNKSNNKNNSINITDENNEDNLLCFFSDGNKQKSLSEGEQVVGTWSF